MQVNGLEKMYKLFSVNFQVIFVSIKVTDKSVSEGPLIIF